MPQITYNENRYTGTSAVTKPTDGVLPGSEFFESDGVPWIFNGEYWVRTGDGDDYNMLLIQTRLLNLILYQLMRQ